ncbi:hypothetical protein DW841_15415 [Hungatella hathewayi]|nr:hypothetical protein DW841_15415 [Hungatella hathewayi]
MQDGAERPGIPRPSGFQLTTKMTGSVEHRIHVIGAPGYFDCSYPGDGDFYAKKGQKNKKSTRIW